MKTTLCVAVATLFFAAALIPALAQTAPDQEKGSTGWGGGAKDQPTQEANQTPEQKAASDAKDALAAKDMPAMASGSDLLGPTEHFAPRKTPE